MHLWVPQHMKEKTKALWEGKIRYTTYTLVHIFLCSSINLINIHENYICASRGENALIGGFLQEIYYSQHNICLFQISNTSHFRDIKHP